LNGILFGSGILVLLRRLTSGKANAWQAALAGLLAALGAAVGVFRMPPAVALAGVIYGVSVAIFRLGWPIVVAVFLYEMAALSTARQSAFAASATYPFAGIRGSANVSLIQPQASETYCNRECAGPDCSIKLAAIC
jgi:hypothetical protein